MKPLACTPSFGRLTAQQQRGAASLIVVMVLFFVVAMVAAYTNRSLMFEQRTSANQYRSTKALEAADAGVEWALSMLNSGRTTSACLISAVATDTTFRQRYLVIDPETGHLVPKKQSDGVTDLYPTCVNVAGNWTCSCPADGSPNLVAPAGGEAFRVRFRRVCTSPTQPDSACTTPVQPGMIHVDVNGCTRLDDDCLRFNDEPTPGKPLENEGRATVRVLAALVPGLPSAPGAALTVRSNLDIGASTLSVVNRDRAPTGQPNPFITIHAGGTITATAVQLYGADGTPGSQTLRAGDASLQALTADRFFSSSFGMERATYRNQPGLIELDCSAGCTVADISPKVLMNPGRIVWLNGDVNLDSAVTLGSDDEPVVLNVTGNLTFGASATVKGLVYVQAAAWASNGAGIVEGAVVAEGGITGTPSGRFTYSVPIVNRLRSSTGTFVKVPGSWRDFE